MESSVLEKLESSEVLEELENVLAKVESSTMDEVNLVNLEDHSKELEISLVNVFGFLENEGLEEQQRLRKLNMLEDVEKKLKEKD